MTPEQRKKLEEQMRQEMSAPKQGLSFDVPNLFDIPKALGNVASGVVDAGKKLFSMSETANQPVFQTRTLAEKRDIANELAELNKQEAELEAKYGKFNPLEGSLAEFESQAMSKIPGTPLLAPWMLEEEPKTNLKMSVAKTTSNTSAAPAKPTQTEEAKKTNLYDLMTSAPTKNTAYEEALRKQEEGLRLAALLSGSAKIGRAVAGAGRLSESTEDFKDVANLYGDDRRVLDETAKRAEVEEAQKAMDPNSNVSRAMQIETAELLKALGQEIKDPEALSRMSGKELVPHLALLKQRVETEQKKKQREEDKAYKYDYMNLQERMHNASMANQKAMRELEKENKAAIREKEVDFKVENDVNKFITQRSDKLRGYREDLKKIKPNLKNLESMLAQDVNSVEQINAIYDFIKRLDNTAVREGEIKLFGQGQSVFDDFEVLKSKLTKNPKVISTAQFNKLFERLKQATAATEDFYKDELKKTELEFNNRAKRLLAKDPSYKETLTAVDPQYFGQEAEQAQGPSKNTLDLINSRSEEENKKRLEELRAKRGANR